MSVKYYLPRASIKAIESVVRHKIGKYKQKIRMAQMYQKNKQKISERSTLWRQCHVERVREINKKHYNNMDNKPKILNRLHKNYQEKKLIKQQSKLLKQNEN